jgi:hypothetical protein
VHYKVLLLFEAKATGHCTLQSVAVVGAKETCHCVLNVLLFAAKATGHCALQSVSVVCSQSSLSLCISMCCCCWQPKQLVTVHYKELLLFAA